MSGQVLSAGRERVAADRKLKSDASEPNWIRAMWRGLCESGSRLQTFCPRPPKTQDLSKRAGQRLCLRKLREAALTLYSSAMNGCMSLLTRRVFQKCLDDNAQFVSIDVLRNWVQQLNRVSNDYVATEWEVVLLRAFARFGKVRYEPPLGQRPVDLVFESCDGKLQFAADIVAISDQPLHEKNPIDRFRDEFNKRIEKTKINTGRFIFQVEEEQPVACRGTGRKRRLLLPPVREFSTYVFNAAFDDYI
jgi:hypothetical protein